MGSTVITEATSLAECRLLVSQDKDDQADKGDQPIQFETVQTRGLVGDQCIAPCPK